LNHLLQDVTSIHVETYVSDDLGNVGYDAGTKRLTGSVSPRVITHVSADGDTFVVVPSDTGQLDDKTWKQHVDAVGQAQEYRTELMRTATASIASLLGIRKPE